LEDFLPSELQWYGKRLDTQFKHIRLVIISDVHYGNPLFSLNHFRRTIKFIQSNDDVFAALNGDLLECVTRNSKGNVYGQVLSPRTQRDDVIDLLMPIKTKLVGMTTGNHELRLQDADADFSEDISRALGIPYRPAGMFYKLSFGDGNRNIKGKPYTFRGYWTHGYGGARTKSAKAVKAERLSAFTVSDFYGMSHDHDVNIAFMIKLDQDERGFPSDYEGFIRGKVTASRAILLKTNAYVKWGDYSEIGGFSPSDLETPVLLLLTPESEYWNLVPDKPKKGIKVIA
jgi:hypothetical protein